MEKCTFCVQRIRGAQNRARLEDRSVQDGEITPRARRPARRRRSCSGDLHDETFARRGARPGPPWISRARGIEHPAAITYLAKVVHGAVVEG